VPPHDQNVVLSYTPPRRFVELEWNPFTTASRAARADRAGRLGEALPLYVRAAQFERIPEAIWFGLPSGRVRQALADAASEWAGLAQSLERAPGRQLPDGWRDWYETALEGAAEVLWSAADRLTVGLRGRTISARLEAILAREIERLHRLAHTLAEAHDSLTELVLTGAGTAPDAEKARRRLESLSRAVEDVRENDDALA